MTHARRMLEGYPGVLKVDAAALAGTIDALHDCVQACTADADADFSERHLADLVKCIRLCLDCADVCAATAAVITRQIEFDSNAIRPLVEACVVTCKICGDECERHAQMHEHCRSCAQACRRCEQAYREPLVALTPGEVGAL